MVELQQSLHEETETIINLPAARKLAFSLIAPGGTSSVLTARYAKVAVIDTNSFIFRPVQHVCSHTFASLASASCQLQLSPLPVHVHDWPDVHASVVMSVVGATKKSVNALIGLLSRRPP